MRQGWEFIIIRYEWERRDLEFGDDDDHPYCGGCDSDDDGRRRRRGVDPRRLWPPGGPCERWNGTNHTHSIGGEEADEVCRRTARVILLEGEWESLPKDMIMNTTNMNTNINTNMNINMNTTNMNTTTMYTCM